MIEYHTGNIMESKCQAITNTINCVGVMGKGLALQFKKRYPAMFEAYKKACQRKEIRIGRMWLWQPEFGRELIINFPTKNHWRNHSLEVYIQLGLKDIHRVIQEKRLQSLALPALGCQNGGMEWQYVKGLIEGFSLFVPRCLKKIEVYYPH